MQTKVETQGTSFIINDEPTYAGTLCEGMLFNVRTVNATFDDTLGKVDWFHDRGDRAGNGNAGYGEWSSPESADANTDRFVEGLKDYLDRGILAVNLCLQGGHPLNGMPEIEEGHGSAGRRPDGHRDFYHNSVQNSDGSLDPMGLSRVDRVIEACDAIGMVVMLQLFYFGQDPVFEDEAAICAATDASVDWLCERGYTNVIVEIANEVMEGHFHHAILKPGRVTELIHRVRDRARDKHGVKLLVMTSEAALLSEKQWKEEEIDEVMSACDFCVIHGGDNVETGKVGDTSQLVDKVKRIRSTEWYAAHPRPIITNESQGEPSFDAMVKRGVSFGLHSEFFQTMYPPRWGVWDNDTTWFFKRVKNITAGS
jgi:hypothetical protein